MSKTVEDSSGISLNSTRTDEESSQNTRAQSTTGGLARLMACCGILKAPRQEVQPFMDNSHCEAAISNLLRRNSGPSEAITRIPHIRQSETWDCGIACLQMVLLWLRDEEDDSGTVSSLSTQKMERNLLLSRVGTQSIWTVDLVVLFENLLQDNKGTRQPPNHNNTTYLFCSRVMGVNAQHSTTGYYEKAFTADNARVDKLCEDMNRLELPVLCPYPLEFHQLIDLVSNPHCIAILLVDSHYLWKDVEDNNLQQHKDSYMGHYVILCGISRDPDHLVQAYTAERLAMEEPSHSYCLAVCNPGIAQPLMFVKPERLERAWRADGTDCDVIFVAKHDLSSGG